MGDPTAMRRSGIDVVGDVPWGTHFCQFYETSADLIETLVPYFREGLAANEFCMWITSEPVRVDEAVAALRAEVADLDEYIRKGQIEILDFSQWYIRSGRFCAEEVLQGWVDKLNSARQRGYEGLRLTGNTFWLEQSHWDDFTQYEEMVNNVIGQYRMLALCTYSLGKCGAMEIMDVVSNHKFALIKQSGHWKIIESSFYKTMGRALHESEDRFWSLFNSMTEGFALHEIITDKSGQPQDYRFLDVNPAFERLSGLKRDALIGRTVLDVLPGTERVWIEKYGQVALSGTPVRFQEYSRRIGKHLEVYAYSPAPGRCAVIITDITERKEAEQALLASQDRLNRAEEIAHLGSWELDLVNDRLSWSDEVYRLFGLRPQEFGATYKAFLESVHPEDRSAVDAAYSDSLRQGSDEYEIEHRVIRKDTGEIRVVHEKCRHVRDASGKVIRSVGMVLDITDRKRTEAEIRSLAQFPQENPNPVMRAGGDGELLYANHPGMSLLEKMGWRKGSRLPEVLARPLGLALKTGAGQEVEFSTSWGRVYVFTLSPNTEQGWVNLYGRDRTERKEAEDGLRRLNRTLKALGRSSQALMRVSEEHAYLREVCNIVVEDCGHAMVWIGYAQDDKNKTVRPVAWAGFDDGYLETLNLTWADNERGRGPTGMAIRTGKPALCRNMLTDPFFAPWREQALKRGYASSLVLPLGSAGRVFGAITIYSAEPAGFDDQDIRLMTELADDLAQGITAFRMREDKARAEEAIVKERDSLEIRVKERTADLERLVGVLQREVAERQRVEMVVRMSNAYNRGLIEASLDPLVTIGSDGRISDVNAATELATGVPRAQLIGSEFSDYFTSPERARAGYRQVLAEGLVLDYPLTIRSASGKATDVLYNATVYRNEAGEVQGVFAAARDVTARNKAEAEARAERQRLFSVLNLVPGYVALKDQGHRIRFANHGYLEIFGEPSGRYCYEVQYGRNQPCENCRVLRVLESGLYEEWEWTHSNGKTYHVWVFPFTDTDGTPLMMQLGLDVTDRKRLELMVAEANETERRRIGRDLHDMLGQSLTGLGYLVGGLSEKLAAKSPQDTAVAKQIIETVKEAVGQVRALSRGLDPIGLEADGLVNALGELARTFRAASGIPCEFRCDRPVTLEAFTATHLYRIAQEALTNAAKHAHAKHIVIRLAGGAESLSLRVEDDGIGIATVARDNEGMGLRVMRYRAGAIGAALTVSAGRNGGTVVTCTLSGNACRTQAGGEQK